MTQLGGNGMAESLYHFLFDVPRAAAPTASGPVLEFIPSFKEHFYYTSLLPNNIVPNSPIDNSCYVDIGVSSYAQNGRKQEAR